MAAKGKEELIVFSKLERLGGILAWYVLGTLLTEEMENFCKQRRQEVIGMLDNWEPAATAMQIAFQRRSSAEQCGWPKARILRRLLGEEWGALAAWALFALGQPHCFLSLNMAQA